MKVLHVIPSIGPLRGGPSRAALDMCRGLARQGVDVTLATTDDNGLGRLKVPLGKSVEQDGYRVLYFRRTTRGYCVSWRMTSWLAQHIHEYDLVHVHAVFCYPSMVAAFLAYGRGVPYALAPHGILLSWGLRAGRTGAKRLSYALFEKQMLDRAAFVHATSGREADELRATQPRAPIRVIHLGVDVPSMDSFPKESLASVHPELRSRIVLLFLGRFHAIKGLDLLLPAFSSVTKQISGILLALAGDGDGDYNAWLDTEILRLGICASVIRLGFLQDDAKWQALAGTDIFVLPSYSESFGISAVEAMACAKPVIVSDQVALSGEVAEARAGLVIPCQVEPLAEAIIELSSDPARRKQMGQNGRHVYETRFTVSHMVQAMLRSYREVLGE